MDAPEESPQPWHPAPGVRHAPAAARNRDPLTDALRPLLPATGLVLEVASGTGEHAVHFARRFPELEWQPTDADPAALESIAAWSETRPAPNLFGPLRLDVREPWPVERANAVLAINLLHISPWPATEALVVGAARVLPPGGPLIAYGPFWREGVEPAASNLAFHESLRARDPAWGVRRLEEVSAAAEEVGLTLEGVTEMPANNLLVCWRREVGT